MMNNFCVKSKRIFLIDEQQSQSITHLNILTSGKVSYAQTAEADITRLTQA